MRADNSRERQRQDNGEDGDGGDGGDGGVQNLNYGDEEYWEAGNCGEGVGNEHWRLRYESMRFHGPRSCRILTLIITASCLPYVSSYVYSSLFPYFLYLTLPTSFLVSGSLSLHTFPSAFSCSCSFPVLLSHSFPFIHPAPFPAISYYHSTPLSFPSFTLSFPLLFHDILILLILLTPSPIPPYPSCHSSPPGPACPYTCLPLVTTPTPTPTPTPTAIATAVAEDTKQRM